MKLFISYSRQDEKWWALEFWRALRDEAHHDAWIDQRLVPAQDWWKTILDEIENCECFIYVMTPKSVESIYCLAELEYALAINKPVLPLKLKDCDEPANLKELQYQVVGDHMSMDKVLLRVEQGLGQVQLRIANGEHELVDSPRPDAPKPDKNHEHVYEVFALAEEAFADGELTFAEQYYQQVVEVDRDGLREVAQEQLDEIAVQRDCATAYANVNRLLENPKTLRGARAAWRTYLKKCPDYDPDDLAGDDRLRTETGPSAKSKYRKSNIYGILPQPFDLIEIPAGKVTLEKGGYLEEATEFEVPAFVIAKYPVTNAQYAKFVEAGGAEPLYWRDSKWNQPDHPVVGVSWYEALAFCEWLSEISGENITLPTEQQWQRAAQGDDNRTYPWGNGWDCKRCNNSDPPCQSNGTTSVTHYEGRVDSPFEIVDMAGNVWEWCLTEWDTRASTAGAAGWHVLRGGSFYNGDYYSRSTYRNFSDPINQNYGIGLRVVLSPEMSL